MSADKALQRMPSRSARGPARHAPTSRPKGLRQAYRLSAAVVLALYTAHAAADCPPQQFRWLEDCRTLAENRSELGAIERLRYMPLAQDGSTWLTLGGEYRLRVEHTEAPSFGLRATPDFTATGHRALLHADLRSAYGARVFVQVGAAAEEGRQPVTRSFDEGALDLTQGFVDLPIGAGYVRLGRQELNLFGNRLVSTRDAANFRRTFDAALLDLSVADTRVLLFNARPVLNRRGAFDDERTPVERFIGAYLHPALSLEAFLFERKRPIALYQDARGAEDRKTLGARFVRATGETDFSAQAAVQWGSLEDSTIRAWGFAGDVGYRVVDLAWRPRFGASFGYASGDRHPNDRELGTFDVLYPNLGYFTDAPIVYPGNSWDVQPNVTLLPRPDLSWQTGVDSVFRVTTNDAIYESRGLPLVAGTGSGSKSVAALAYTKLVWRPASYLEFIVSLVRAYAGPAIAAAGGRDETFVLIQLATKF